LFKPVITQRNNPSVFKRAFLPHHYPNRHHPSVIHTNSFMFKSKNNKALAPKKGQEHKTPVVPPKLAKKPTHCRTFMIYAPRKTGGVPVRCYSPLAFVLPSEVHSERRLLPQSHRLGLSLKSRSEPTSPRQRFLYVHLIILRRIFFVNDYHCHPMPVILRDYIWEKDLHDLNVPVLGSRVGFCWVFLDTCFSQ